MKVLTLAVILLAGAGFLFAKKTHWSFAILDRPERMDDDDSLEACITSYELAFRMQTAVTEVTNLDLESETTNQLHPRPS